MSHSPFVMVIFGATGDLTHRKLLPALYKLYSKAEISREMFVVGVGRRDLKREQFQGLMREAAGNPADWDGFAANMHYVPGMFADRQLYGQLTDLLSTFDKKLQACVPRFFYLATPPEHYLEILTQLGDSKLAEGCGHGTANFTRVLIEKPFGKDLATAQKLDQQLAAIFAEKQIYRIDHYLGKETVQNIIALRFGNGIFEPTWNREFVDHVQITLAEELGVGNRAGFYDGVGALRDVVQNHMLEMLALIAMEQPRGLDAESIRDARAAAMGAISLPHENPVEIFVRGQYTGYRQEPGVAADSQTETFAALKLAVDTDCWRGVPFYLRTGKKLDRKVTEISLHYKKPVCQDDICFFHPDQVMRNVLSIRIYPVEGVTLRLVAKKPGFGLTIAPVNMDFGYRQSFDSDREPDAYERLLVDAISGDQTLFARTDSLMSSWRLTTDILDKWHQIELEIYEPGTQGPESAVRLLARDNRKWFLSR